jgi:hypothetical protein
LYQRQNIEIIDVADGPRPKGIIPLENIIDENDMYKGITLKKISDEIVEFNIGTKDSPKLIKFGKVMTTKKREKLIALIREFKYLFSWSY